MIIRIHDISKHRNETTFRPYLSAGNLFRDMAGITFTVADTNRYDILWVGQASYMDKTLPLADSVAAGVDMIGQTHGPVMLFDGQDSPSLMGSGGVYQRSKELYGGRIIGLYKNSLLSDPSIYMAGTNMGRSYWGPGEFKFEMCPGIKLSGSNWLSTIPFRYASMEYNRKDIDVSGLFGYQLTTGSEFGIPHYQFYNAFRKPCVDALVGLRGKLSVEVLDGGQRLSPEVYYQTMRRSKIIVAPFGYGEIAPRDFEAAVFGAVLIKPDMSHVNTAPNIYIPGVTYVPCRHDFSDLPDVIQSVLDNPSRMDIPRNFIKLYNGAYHPAELVKYVYETLVTDIPGIQIEG